MFLLALLVGFFISNLLTAQQVPFSDWANQSGLQVPFGMGVSLVDVNQDGYEDVFIARKNRDNLLYLNLVDGTFEDVSAAAGVDYIGTSLQSIWVDYDQDGDIDLDDFDVFLVARFLLCVDTGDGGEMLW